VDTKLAAPTRAVMIPPGAPGKPFPGAKGKKGKIDPRRYLLTPEILATERAEVYRQLKAVIRLNPAAPQVILFTSARHGEGRTISALNLAIAFAQESDRIAYVEADFRRPGLANLFAVDEDRCLSRLLLQGGVVGDMMQASEVPGLYLLPAGRPPASPELLASPQMRSVLEALRRGGDRVIIDCAPYLPYAEASLLAAQLDGVVLVTREGASREDEIKLLNHRLTDAKTRVLSAIFLR
jgi:protein-tyrosine kinase